MILIELAKEVGLAPIRVGTSYSSPCPKCEGTDRFIIWPNDKYWCRRCEKKGDAIQFCRDFLGLTYSEACKKLNVEIKAYSNSTPLKREELKLAKEPPLLWQERALAFTNWSHFNLMNNPNQLSLVQEERKFSIETIIKYRLGLCINDRPAQSKDFFINRTQWGLLEIFKENEIPKKLWLPYGLVIPSFESESVMKLKIRRSKWHENDKLPKYVEIAGSMQKPSWFSQNNLLPVIIVESEFDAILIQQEAGDLCSSIALGGATKRADAVTHQLLKNTSLILYGLDFDEAGKKHYKFWRQKYPNLRAWPIPITKSPGDAFKKGISIRQWILEGISQYQIVLNKGQCT